MEIDLHDAEIAYKIGDRYFTMLNNSMVKDIVKSVNEGVRAFSIVERLELAKEQLSGEKSESKPLKDTVKKPEMGID